MYTTAPVWHVISNICIHYNILLKCGKSLLDSTFHSLYYTKLDITWTYSTLYIFPVLCCYRFLSCTRLKNAVILLYTNTTITTWYCCYYCTGGKYTTTISTIAVDIIIFYNYCCYTASPLFHWIHCCCKYSLADQICIRPPLRIFPNKCTCFLLGSF